MKFLERDLEEILFESKMQDIAERGIVTSRHLKRQVRIGNYGRADLIGVDTFDFDNNGVLDKKLEITIYELKQDKVSVSTFLQAIGYARGIKHWLKKHKPRLYDTASFRIVLVGRNVDSFSSFIYLPYLISSENFLFEIYTYSYDIDGIKFTTHKDYQIKNSGF